MPDGSLYVPRQLDRAQLEPFLERAVGVTECWGGCLVACGYGEQPGMYARLEPQIHVVENDFDAVENLIGAFEAINAVPGLNGYLSVGLFKPRDQWRNPAGRGAECDLIGTFAFVGDFDRGHDPASFLDRLPLPPHAIVETSAGNFQPWLFLDRPYPVSDAKPVFKALTRAMGSDATFSCEHVFRPPGTWNWPGRKKVLAVAQGGHGRAPQPQLARAVDAGTNIRAVTLAGLREAITEKYPSAFDRIHPATATDFDWHQPATKTRTAIEPGYFERRLNEAGDRSRIAATAINRCRQSGWTPEETFEALTAREGSPVMDHYGGSEARLRADIERLWVKPAPEKYPDPSAYAVTVATPERQRSQDEAASAAGRWPLAHIRDRATALSAPDPVMLVEGIIPDRKLIMPWGDTGCGKTYWSLEIATAVAMRRPAFGRFDIVKPAAPGVAVIFAGEDCDYIDKCRLTVIERHFDRSLQGLVYTVGTAIPINDPNLFEAYRDELHRLQDITGKPIDIVVNDTLKRSLGLLKQNDDDTGRRFTAAMEGLIADFGCPILCNAHQPKSGPDGAIAGTGDFTANCPVTPHLIGKKDGRQQLASIECRFEPKFRVGPAPQPFTVKAVPVALPKLVAGVASDLVLVAISEAEQASRAPSRAARMAEEEDCRRIERTLCEAGARDLDSGLTTEVLVVRLVGSRWEGESDNDYAKRKKSWKDRLDNGARRPEGNPAFGRYFDLDHRGDRSLRIPRPVRKWFVAVPTKAEEDGGLQ